MRRMPDSYAQLLNAAISHLEEMKARGTTYVDVSPNTLSELKNFPKRIAPKKPLLPSVAVPGINLLPVSQSIAAPISGKSQGKESLVFFDLPLEKGHSSPSPVPPLDRAAKEAAFADLRRRAMACVKCE